MSPACASVSDSGLHAACTRASARRSPPSHCATPHLRPSPCSRPPCGRPTCAQPENTMTDFKITSSADNLVGGKDDDTFRITGSYKDLAATDKIAGGDGNDQLVLRFSSDTEKLVDAQFAGVSSVEVISIDPAVNQQTHMVLGAKAGAAGITLVDGSNADDVLEVDASAYSNKAGTGITVIAGEGANNGILLTGSKFDDTFKIVAGSESVATIAGGAGSDTLVIEVSGSGLSDLGFKSFSGIEKLVLSGLGATVQAGATLGAAGITMVDGSQVSGLLYVDAGYYANKAGTGLTIVGSAAASTLLIGSSKADTFRFSAADISAIAPTILGGNGSDTLEIVAGGGATVSDASFASLSSIDLLRITGDTGNVTLGAAATASLINLVDGTVISDSLTVDASGYQADGLTIKAADGTKSSGNAITGSAFADIVQIKAGTFDAGDTIAGGDGADTIQVYGDGKAAIVVADAAFANVSGEETLQLTGAPGGTVTLGASAAAAGIRTVDVSAIAGAVKIDASGDVAGLEIITGTGAVTLTGGIGDDTFRFTSAGLTATDKVDGGLGSDRIVITDKAAIADAAFTGVKNVEEIVVGDGETLLADYSGAKVALGKLSEAAGIVSVTNTAEFGLAVDESGRAKSGVVFDGGAGDDSLVAGAFDEVFTGGAGDDSLSIKLANLTGADRFTGGAGIDTLRISDSDTAKSTKTELTVVDADFTGLISVERLVFDGTGRQQVAVDALADAAGLQVIDGSKAAGGLFVTATSGFNDALSIIASAGENNISHAGPNLFEVYLASTTLNSKDAIDGGASGILHFTDAVKLTDAFFGLNVQGVQGMTRLDLDNAAAGQSFVAGANFAKFVTQSTLSVVEATSTQASAGVTFDFSGYAGLAITVDGAAGNDTFIGGKVANGFFGGDGDDVFKYSSAALSGAAPNAHGGDGTDSLVFTDAGTNASPLLIDEFVDVDSVEKLVLGAAKQGSYKVELGSAADSAGIVTIDAAQAGVDVSIDTQNSNLAHVILAGGKNNTIVDGLGYLEVRIDAKTLDAGDTLTAASGGGGTLTFTGAGSVAAAAFANVTGFEKIKLSDAGNSVVLNDAMIDSSTGTALVLNGMYLQAVKLTVLGGKGNDTVDLTNNTHTVAVIAGAGKDTLIGSGQDDVFAFEKPTDLDAGDVIKGGGGNDTVLLGTGSYSSDQFKGFSGIETVEVINADIHAADAVTVKNDFFANAVADPNDAGAKLLKVQFQSISGSSVRLDGSAVTGSLNNLDVTLTGGTRTLIGGAGDDTFRFIGGPTSADTVVGGAGFDTIGLTGVAAGAVSFTTVDFTGVTGIEQIAIDPTAAGNVTLTVDAVTAAAAGIGQVTAAGYDHNLTLKAGAYSAGLTLHAGSGDDDLTFGAGDDTVVFANGGDLDYNDRIEGGSGSGDAIVIADGSTVTDGQFAGVHNVEILRLAGGSLGITQSVTLGKAAADAGIRTVDASQAQAGVTVTGANDVATTIVGSRFSDTLSGDQGSIFYGGLGADHLISGGANDVFVYRNVEESRDSAVQSIDYISNFGSNDKFDFANLTHVPTKAVVSTIGGPDGQEAAFFKNNGGDVVAVYSKAANATDIYVDADGNGSYDAAKDMKILVQGDITKYVATLLTTSSSGVSADPFHPVLSESSPMTLAKGNYTDANFDQSQGAPTLVGTDAFKPSDLTAAYTFDIGVLTDLVRVFDWSSSKGALTIDASDRQNPIYVAAGSGVSTLTGTGADDIFYFSSAALAKSTVNGGNADTGDRDTLFISDKVSLADTAFAKVSHIEILELGASPVPGVAPVDVSGQKVTLGAKSVAAGIDTVVNDWAAGLTVDASARSKGLTFEGGYGDDIFIGATAATVGDTFHGGGGNDSFRLKLASFTVADSFDGGLGKDEIRILDSDNTTTKITDDDFTHLSSVETLVFDAAGKQDVTVGSLAQAAGLTLIDGSKTTGLTVSVDGSYQGELSVIAGTGNDTIMLGFGGGDVYIASTKLTKDDTIDGAGFGNSVLHFTDSVKITDSYFKDNVSKVTGFKEIHFDGTGAGQTFAAGSNFAQFIDSASSYKLVVDNAVGMTVDLSALSTSVGGQFIGGAGNDTLLIGSKVGLLADLGAGNDTLQANFTDFAARATTVDGGAGNDTFLATSEVSNLGVTTFAYLSNFEVLKLGAAKSGSYTVEIASESAGAITRVDATAAGVDVKVSAVYMNTGITFLSGTKGNNLSGSSGDDTFLFDAKSFDGSDTADGSIGIDTLTFTTGGTISAAGLANLSGIEAIRLSDAGNSLAVAAALAGQGETAVNLVVGGAFIGAFDLAIYGGKGKDTVDLGNEGTSGHVAVFAGAGSDTLIGGGNENTFVFANAGDLDKSDVVKGGSDFDTVVIAAGAYAADAFKGMTSIESIVVADDNAKATDTASIALDNAFVKGAAVFDGLYGFQIVFGDGSIGREVVDLSKITLANGEVETFFGAGNATFSGGAERDFIHFQGDGNGGFLLDDGDKVSGGLGIDTLSLDSSESNATVLDDLFAKVSGVERLELTGGSGTSYDVTLSANALKAGIAEVDATDIGNGNLLLEAGGMSGGLTVYLGAGTASFLGFGAGDDTVVFKEGISTLVSGDTLFGGGTAGKGNALVFDGDFTIGDGSFLHTHSFGRIASVEGTLNLTLGTNASSAAITHIDATESHGLTLTVASGFTGSLAVEGSAFADKVTAGDGGVQVAGHGGADDLIGGKGGDTFIYTESTDSVLLAGGSTAAMDTIENFLKNGGDSIDLTRFSSVLTGNVWNASYANLSDATAAATAFFDQGPSGDGKGDIVVAHIGADFYLFADTNKDGNLTLNGDLAIKVVGVSGVSASDIADAITL
jgi:Ca2+-binding RTX toxin-like protein